MNINFFKNGAEKPDRVSSERNEQYDLQMGRYCCNAGLNQAHENFLLNADTNIRFWKGDQWYLDEDIEVFLKDENNNSKNRIKVNNNKIYPIVAQYLGNARNMDLSYKAINTSPDVINRREEALAQLLFMTELANASAPGFKAYVRENYPVGETMQETETMFDNNWTDSFTRSVNQFLKEIVAENDLNKYKEELAFYLSLTGLCGLKYDFHNGDYIVEPLNVFKYFYDNSCLRKDFSDAMFMGECDDMAPEDILERYNPDPKYKAAIVGEADYTDEFQGKKTVVKVYFKDYDRQRFGWVMDPFGYHYLVRLDYDMDGVTYSDKDLLPEKELSKVEIGILGGNQGYAYFDHTRYCHFLPSEMTAGDKMPENKPGDIVLEHGIYPYQETQVYKMGNIKFPYKPSSWYYEGGVIFTPVSALINPQRMVNRMGSVAESLLSSAMPKSLHYDINMVEDETTYLNNFYAGKPNAVDTRGLGISNLAHEVGSGVDKDVGVYAQMIESASQSMDRMIGVNESLRGENQGANKLVGVTAMEIQRASLSQESFYGALEGVYHQIYDSIANVARRVYADNDREIAILVGDKYAEVLKISKEYNLEDFRCHVTRTVDPEQKKAMNQEKLINLTLQGLISKPLLGKYYNDPTDEDISDALREQSVIDTEMAKMQMQAQQEEQEALQDEQAVQEARADATEQNELMIENKKVDNAGEKQAAHIEKLANNQRQKQ